MGQSLAHYNDQLDGLINNNTIKDQRDYCLNNARHNHKPVHGNQRFYKITSHKKRRSVDQCRDGNRVLDSCNRLGMHSPVCVSLHPN